MALGDQEWRQETIIGLLVRQKHYAELCQQMITIAHTDWAYYCMLHNCHISCREANQVINHVNPLRTVQAGSVHVTELVSARLLFLWPNDWWLWLWTRRLELGVKQFFALNSWYHTLHLHDWTPSCHSVKSGTLSRRLSYILALWYYAYSYPGANDMIWVLSLNRPSRQNYQSL